MDIENSIKNLVKKHVKSYIKLEVPPDSSLGDYALPCFYLSREFKKSPIEIAKELEKTIKPTKDIEKILAIGPYLNFFVNKKEYMKYVLGEINSKKSKYGCQNLGKKKKLMIEFSQANTHKAFHVGHVRGTSLGESLARIYSFLNYKVIRANYQGDTGAHVAKWLWYYTKYYKKQLPKKNAEKEIAKIYVESVKKLEENPLFQEEVDKINYDLENKKDKKLFSIWQKTRKYSLEEFEKIYKQLNTKFDLYFFEREMEKPAKNVVNEMLKKEVAAISDNAAIIDLEKYNLGKWVLLRKDGTVLYSAKDIALAKIKFEKYKIKKSIYVVGASQTLHLQQLFKTLELLNFKQAKDCYHLSFSEVRLPTGKMSSRTGENILYSDLFSESLKMAIAESKSRNPQWSKSKIGAKSREITIAAIKFSMLSQDPNKAIVFDQKKELEFEGDTGPYIQYTYARLCSILRKSKKFKQKFEKLEEEMEYGLVKKLSEFQEIVEKSAREYKPNILANYLIELSRITNEFYHKYNVIKAESKTRESRLFLISAVKTVIKNSLDLLGITAIESM